MTTFKDYCIHIFSHVKPQATFLSILHYTNNFGEVSDFTVCFHVNYLNAVRRSKEIVNKYIPKNNVEKEAKDYLLWSFDQSLTGDHPLYTCRDIYDDIPDKDGHPIPGVMLHKRQDIVHINALRVRKKVVSEGLYPDRNSSPLTLAKRKIKFNTPLSKWVQFKLVPKRFNKLSVQKMTIKG